MTTKYRVANIIGGLALTFLPACVMAQVDTLALELYRAVFLESGGAFNLSGLTATADGWLFFSDDNGPAPDDWSAPNPVLLRIRTAAVLDTSLARPALERVDPAAGDLAWSQLAGSAAKTWKYDLEGIAEIYPGKLWMADERDRLVIEFDLEKKSLRLVAGAAALAGWDERLAAGGINNGFEGIARVGKRLFLAHEMTPNLIAVYTLGDTLAAEGTLEIAGSYDINGLEADGRYLYALGRTPSLVYKLDPETGKVVGAANFRREADDLRYRYRNRMDFYRNSEGLALDKSFIYLVMDGNFQPLVEDPGQSLPLLLIYRRPPGF